MLMFNGEFEIDSSYILKMKFDQYFCKNTFQWIKRRKKIWAKAVSMFGGVFHSGSAVQIVKYTSSWSKMVPMIFHSLNKAIWSYMQILEECKFQIRAFSKEMEYGSSAAESERASHDTSDKMSLNSPTMSRF